MKKNFKRFQLTPEIEEALDALGYDEPTPIQIQAIPVIMAKQDIVGQSQTGSGKTAAFVFILVAWRLGYIHPTGIPHGQ